MFKDDMLPLTENQEKTSSLPSLLNFNESRKVNSDLSSFFNKIEEEGILLDSVTDSWI